MWSRSPTFGDAHLHLEVVALTKGNFVLLELGQSPMISAAIFELHLYLLDPASLISNSANTGFVLASISSVVAMTAIANVEARCCSFSIGSCSKSAPQKACFWPTLLAVAPRLRPERITVHLNCLRPHLSR
jgi:hypothetical protein